MSSLGFLDLVVGLVFIYFLLSLVVSSLQEIRANLFKLRAKNLEQWFLDTLNTNQLGKTLLKHKLISGLVKQGRKPSYVPTDNFVAALLDIISVKSNGGKPYDIDTLKNAIDKTDLLPDDLKRYIQQSISEASGELQVVKKDIGQWFDNCMDRVGGTYKNLQQTALVVISFIVVAFLNADSISLSKFLYENEEIRIELANQAANASQDSTLSLITKKYIQLDSLKNAGTELDSASTKAIEDIQLGINELKLISGKLEDANLPLGWSDNKTSIITYHLDLFGWLMKITGLLISALAVSLGTPFWFDTLNKLVNLRGAGSKPVTMQTGNTKNKKM